MLPKFCKVESGEAPQCAAQTLGHLTPLAAALAPAPTPAAIVASAAARAFAFEASERGASGRISLDPMATTLR